MVDDEIQSSGHEQPLLGDASSQKLERIFHQKMVETYEQAKTDVGYVAARFLQMLAERGGVETAHQLLASTQVSDGFTVLWEAKRLDLTVEARVLRPEFAPLFTQEEKDVARERLKRFGYRE